MPIPSKVDLRRPLLEKIAAGVSEKQRLYQEMRRHFTLSQEDWETRTSSGHRTLLPRVNWAIFDLMQANLVERVGRGEYKATSDGKALLKNRNEEIDDAFIHTIPAFVDYVKRLRSKKAKDFDTLENYSLVPTELTPQERIADAKLEIEEGLAGDLLSRLLEASAAFFEKAVVDLLVAMGYGRGREGAGRRLGRSGDGGIDGIINEDALGLDAVYIQAKRYADGNTVGRPAIQQFVGSLTGEGASKGVFVTTSAFSKEARDYAARVQQRVVLIDGAHFARLMIAHGVGVRPVETIVLSEIDENFFAED